MNVVDSSAWLEYVAGGPNAEHFAPVIERPAKLIVPTITLFEVFKRLRTQRDETTALQVVAVMHQGRLVDLDAALSLEAARLSVAHGLPLADSVVLATARRHGATVWTQDADFEGLDGVEFRARQA